MDSLTHALAAAVITYILGVPELMPFAVTGVVIIDADVLYSLFSNRHPSLYLFVHGGITHSFLGAVVMSVLAYAGIALFSVAGIIDPAFLVRAGYYGFFAVLAGAFLHIAMDLPATPGIPLFAPKSDTKYALFILPGPSIFMFVISLVFLTWMAIGITTFEKGMPLYLAIFGAFLLFRFVAYLFSRPGLRGTWRAIPQVNPLYWLAINDSGNAWTVRDYRIGRGIMNEVIYPKFTGTDSGEIARYQGLPEIRRLNYTSYIVTAKKEGDTITLSDPIRESERLFYPPQFKRVTLKESRSSGSPTGTGFL
ncbi:MAG TPA: metal-dependent hydrolase [Methanoregula sp.]|nr:metal-dependent hydrolase [Methanoregula sp.]